MAEYENHPSQKPKALLERIILASSHPKDIVLDPFSGTFTTAAVAKQQGRNSISIESQEEYLKIGLRRVLGIEVLHGEMIQPPAKNDIRKNRTGIKGKNTTGDLFDASSDA